jgi:hypothetical protein
MSSVQDFLERRDFGAGPHLLFATVVDTHNFS